MGLKLIIKSENPEVACLDRGRRYSGPLATEVPGVPAFDAGWNVSRHFHGVIKRDDGPLIPLAIKVGAEISLLSMRNIASPAITIPLASCPQCAAEDLRYDRPQLVGRLKFAPEKSAVSRTAKDCFLDLLEISRLIVMELPLNREPGWGEVMVRSGCLWRAKTTPMVGSEWSSP